MAFEYFLYDTNFSNTLVDRGNSSFAPLPPNTGEIFIDFLIPNTQPLYLYRESGATIVLNDQATIDAYLSATNPPTEGSTVNQGEFTGYTATTNIEIEGKVEWEGIYSGATHLKNDMVSDNGWTMIANKDTSDRPAPTAVGSPRNLYNLDELTITGETAKQIVFGMEYTSPVPFWVSGYRVNVTAGNYYEIISIIDAGGANEVSFINAFTASVTGWREFGLVPNPENSGKTTQLLAIVHQPDPTPIEVSYNYEYLKPNNSSIPSIGQITHANKDLSSLLINHTDDDLNDREAFLTGLTVGDLITIGGTQWAIQSSSDFGTYIDFSIAPARQSIAFGVTPVTFETTIASNITYGEDENYWSGSTSIKGVFGKDTGWENVTLDDSQYGVDILVQEAYVSPDWDFVSTAGDGGGSVTNNAIWGTIEGNVINQVDLVNYVTGETEVKIDKVTGATGNVGTFLADGNLQDSGYSIADLTGGTTGGTGATDIYVTGATLVGNVLNLERNGGLPDVTADFQAISDAISDNAADIITVSGQTDTNTSNIADNTSNITTVSGQTDTNTSNITTVSGQTDTNTSNIADNTADITYLSGQTDTKLNTSDFNTYSGVTDSRINFKVDKVTGATPNNITTFVLGGNVQDSGKEFTITIGGEGIATDDRIPTELAVRNAIESAIAGAVQLQGDWNADTNTPDLTVTGITTGYAWRVSVSGNTNLDGITEWAIGDLAIKSATGWIKIENQNIAAIWGNIGGLISDQTDLQAELDSKLNELLFDVYTGLTEIRLTGIESDIQLVSGVTTQNTSDITSNDADITYLSGQTDLKLNTSDFNVYSAATDIQIEGKIPKVSPATEGNLVTLNVDGTLMDTGVSIDSITGGTGFYFYEDRTATINNTTTTDVVYISGTSALLQAGTWSLDFNALGGNTGNNKSIVVGFYVDGVLAGVENSLQANASTNVVPFVLTKDGLLTNATHVFEVRFRQLGGGTAFLDYASIRARLVS